MARNGFKVIVYMDDNPNSPSYMETYEERVEDSGKCPVQEDDLVLISSNCEVVSSGTTGYRLYQYYNRTTNEYVEVREEDSECVESSDEEVWVNSGSPYCEVDDQGINTGFMIQLQVQTNSNAPNYGSTKTTKYKSPLCSDNSCAIWNEIQRSCHISISSCIASFDGTSDITQIDINPLSETYNQTRTINKEDSSCENCTQTVFSWVEVGTLCGDNDLLCENSLKQVTTNSYTVSQKYKTIGNGTPIPMDEYQIVLNVENDEECGYIPPQYEWREAEGEYLCDYVRYTKYKMEVQWVSYDRGVTWGVNPEAQPRRGAVIAYDSYDCGKPMYRWIPNGEYVCVNNGYDSKLTISYRNGNSPYKIDCNESETLLGDELSGLSSSQTNASAVTIGDCVSSIKQLYYNYTITFGTSSRPAFLKIGDYVEDVNIGNGASGYLTCQDNTFPSSVRNISGCNTLRYTDNLLHLRDKVGTISAETFYETEGRLRNVIIDTVIPPTFGYNAFYSGKRYDGYFVSFFVPRGSVEAYKEAFSGDTSLKPLAERTFSIAEEDLFYMASISGESVSGWSFSVEGTEGILTSGMTQTAYKGYANSAFNQVYISEYVTEIGEGAFYASGKTNSPLPIVVRLPSSVKKIGNKAFYYSTSLVDLYCKFSTSSLGEIGEEAFYMCTNLFASPSYVGKIGRRAFCGCVNMKAGRADYCTKIESETFSGCTSMRGLEIGRNVEEIGDRACQDCSSLIANETWGTDFYIPHKVKKIGNYAFAGCSSISYLHINCSGATTIGDYAFNYCTSLKEVTFAEGTTSIGEAAFMSCSSLSSITLPNSVEEIKKNAFAYCSSLSSVTIGSGIVSISDNTFVQLSKFSTLTVYATTPPQMSEYAFYRSTPQVIYVPSQSVDTYKTANGWSTFKNLIRPIT